MKCKLVFTIVILITIQQSFSMTLAMQQSLNKQLVSAILLRNTTKVSSILQDGADVNALGNSLWAPLHHAVIIGDTATVELLLSYGADINTKDNMGQTPLDIAVSKDATAIVEQLLSKVADINAKSNFDITPLDHAAALGNTATVQLLLSNSTDINAKGDADWTPLRFAVFKGHRATVELLKGYQALLEQAQKPTKKLLEIAIEHGYYGLVKLLLQRGLKPNIRHLQLAKNKWQTAEYKQSYKAIGRLLLTQLSLAPGKVFPIPGCISKAGIVGLYGLPETIAQNIATFLE